MAFTPSSLQLDRLKKAIRSYNTVVSRMKESGKYDWGPTKTNLTKELGYISSTKELDERVDQLRRILTTEDRTAQDAVEFHGTVMPKYMKNEIVRGTKAINQRRNDILRELFPGFDDFSQLEKANVLSNRNLNQLNEEDYASPDGFDDLTDELYPNIPRKAEMYISVWEDFGGNPDVSRKIREMAEGDPDGFAKLMESPDIEKEIEYIYGEVGAGSGNGYVGKSGFYYKRSSGYKSSQINRYHNAESYWNEQYENYHNREDYFA